MIMSIKDFELLARVISRIDTFARGTVANMIADALVGHSSTFDKARFLKACGVETKP